VNNLFIDTVQVTVTYLVSSYRNDYEEEQEDAGKETARHFPGVGQYLYGGAKNMTLSYVLWNTFSTVSTEKKYLCAILLYRWRGSSYTRQFVHMTYLFRFS
jgi:hypothetical protein